MTSPARGRDAADALGDGGAPPARPARSSAAAPPSGRGSRSRISAALAPAARGWRVTSLLTSPMSSSIRKRRSMTMRQESGTSGRAGREGNPPVCPPCTELMLRVERRAPSGTTGMGSRLSASAGNSSRLEGCQHRRHVAHGAVAEERHRAVGDLALGLDLGPPDAAMAEADAVLVERLGDDHVIDPRLGETARAAPDGRRRRSRRTPRRPCRRSRWRRESREKRR